MEIWKSIEGTNGRLEVSNRGRVKSNLRDGRILKQQWVSCRDNIKHAYENGLFESVIEGVRKENAKRMKAIKATNIETGEIISFRCIADAERALNTRHITDVLKGKRNSAKGYTFEYQKEVI